MSYVLFIEWSGPNGSWTQRYETPADDAISAVEQAIAAITSVERMVHRVGESIRGVEVVPASQLRRVPVRKRDVPMFEVDAGPVHTG